MTILQLLEKHFINTLATFEIEMLNTSNGNCLLQTSGMVKVGPAMNIPLPAQPHLADQKPDNV